METVKNKYDWYLIYEDSNGEYHVLGPHEEKEIEEPKLAGSGLTEESTMLTLRTLLGETIRCIYPPTGETYIWDAKSSLPVHLR